MSFQTVATFAASSCFRRREGRCPCSPSPGPRRAASPLGMCCTPTRRQHHSEADIHLQTGRLSDITRSSTNNGLLACRRVIYNMCVLKPPSSAAVGAVGTGCTAHRCAQAPASELLGHRSPARSRAAFVPRAVGPNPACSPALRFPPVHFVRAQLEIRQALKKSVPSVSHLVLFVRFTDEI